MDGTDLTREFVATPQPITRVEWVRGTPLPDVLRVLRSVRELRPETAW